MGIRYFDVRFKYQKGVLQAYHGNFEQPSAFADFMNEVSIFLYANPSETVLIRIQNEAGASTNENEFFNRFEAVSSKYYDQIIIPSSINPRLEEVRGKLIFIRDFNVKKKIGLDRRDFFIQDKYTISKPLSLYRKWEDVKKHFNEIKNNPRNISLNYLSGSNPMFPYFVASGKVGNGTYSYQLFTGIVTADKDKYSDFLRHCFGFYCGVYYLGTNQLTNTWIENGKSTGSLGVVVMDFPGSALVKNIIMTNDAHIIIR
jgi:1-phosphatidylinositol phosphodiesterase